MILVSSVFLVRPHTLPRVKDLAMTMIFRFKNSVPSTRLPHVCNELEPKRRGKHSSSLFHWAPLMSHHEISARAVGDVKGRCGA